MVSAGSHLLEEHRKKISDSNKSRIFSEEHRKNISLANKGRKLTEEWKRKIGAASLGRVISEEGRRKRSEAMKGEKNRYFGKHLPESTRQKMSESRMGRIVTKETREKIRSSQPNAKPKIIKICKECNQSFSVHQYREKTALFCSMACLYQWSSKNLIGSAHHSWTGGSTTYCEKWTPEFRERIRVFFNYQCVECGTLQNGTKLHCHHVYYNKKACCLISDNGNYLSNLGINILPAEFEIAGDPNKFVALCTSCHKKAGGSFKNRSVWARHFENIINTYYLGRSYLMQEEYSFTGVLA